MAQLVKTMGGLAIASVKTVNDLAIASVKTVAGLDNTSGGSPTLQDNRPTSDGFGGTALNTSGRRQMANLFKAGSTGGTAPYSATFLECFLKKLGNPPGNFSLCLYSVNASNLPDVLLAESTPVACSSLTTSFVGYMHAIPATALSASTGTNTTWYAIGVKVSADGDAGNCVIWDGSNSGDYYFVNMTDIADATPTWSGQGNQNLRWNVYSG